MKHYIILLLLAAGLNLAFAQTNTVITIAVSPSNHAVDSYSRALNSIKIPATTGTNSIKYGFTSGGATNLLNLNLSSLPSYLDNHYNSPASDPNYYTFDPSLEVAVTSGAWRISDIGSFNYNIPIVCSPGTAGMQPGLSISYNSNGGNGVMGMGFNLSGISAITRQGKNLVLDQAIGGVNFTNNDQFALDGARLIKTNPSAFNDTYHTEVENYSSITSSGNFGAGPSTFTVATPGGITMAYGNTGNSWLTDATGLYDMAWYVHHVYDAFGNEMKFQYINAEGEIRIDRIDYTGNTSKGFSPYNSIEFKYVKRGDKNTFYVAGKKFSRQHLLSAIICRDINQNVVRRYEFDYQFEGMVSLLSKITEVDAAGKNLNPTFFKWRKTSKDGPYSSSTKVTSVTSGVPDFNVAIPADLNGDGRKDLLLLHRTTLNVALVKMSGSPQFTTSTSYINFSPIPSTVSIRAGTVDYITSFTFDEDDDDQEEVYVVSANQTGPTSYDYFVDQVKQVGAGFQVQTVYTSNITVPTNGIPRRYSYLSSFDKYVQGYNHSAFFYRKVDVTGDNLQDVVIADQHKLVVIPWNGSPTVTVNNNDIIKTELGDFDGDGIPEIYTLNASGTSSQFFTCLVYKYDPSTNTLNVVNTTALNIGANPNLSGWPTPYPNSAALNALANGAKSVDFGDFNGDGLTDIMYIEYLNGTDGKAHILRCNGLGFLTDNNPYPVPIWVNNKEANFFAMDVNKDGHSDLAFNSTDAIAGQSNFGFYPSNGNFLTPAAPAQIYHDSYLGVLADFSGDGALDYVYQNSTTHFGIAFNCFDQDGQKMVTNVLNLQDDLKIYYEYLPNEKQHGMSGGFYHYIETPLSPAHTSDFQRVKPSLFVCRGTDDNGRLYKYGYGNALYHRLGRGFLGFERICSMDNNGMGSVTEFTYNAAVSDYVTHTESTTTGFIGLSNFSVDNSKTSAHSKTDMTYTGSGSTRTLSSTQTESWDYLSSTHGKQTTVFETTHGGVESNLVEGLSWNGALINSAKVSYTYQPLSKNLYNHSSTYYRPDQVTQELSTGGPATAHTNKFTYDGSGRLTTSVQNFGTPLAVTTTFSQFNNFGAPEKVSITAADLALPRTQETHYDATGRFAITSINGQGHIAQAVYEPGLGNAIQVTGPTGLVEKTSYDGLGRAIKTTGPTGAVNTSQLEWYQQSPNVYAAKAITKYEANGEATVYFDRNGAPVKTESDGFGGTVESTSQYGMYGELLQQTEPHFSGQPSYNIITYTYDDFYRPTTIYDNTQSVDYFYNNAISSYTAAYIKGSSEVRTKSPAGTPGVFVYKIAENNAAGQVDKVINYENPAAKHISTYSYNEYGSPMQMVTTFPGGTGGATTTFSYDALGRQTAIDDPSAGLNTFAYNSIGELTLSTSPGPQTSTNSISYQYDELGRLLQKIGSSSGTYQYQYATSGPGLGQLEEITGPAVTTEFFYDAYGRPKEKRESIGAGISGKTFSSKYSFDKYDRLKDYTYPGNFRITNEYDSKGFLYKIKNNSTPIWELTGMATPSQVQSYKNSALVTTQIGYTTNQYLSSINLGTVSAQTYSFHAMTGNMTARTHTNFVSTAMNNEGFLYDHFDRLIQTNYDQSGSTQSVQAMTYHHNGNITDKTDVGSYTYSTQPYSLVATQFTVPLLELDETYNEFRKVTQLQNLSGQKFDFIYGNDEQRIKMVYTESGTPKYTRYYQDNFDYEETATGYREWSYIYAPTGLTAVYYNNNNGTGKLLDITTDHLGSPVLVSNQAGTILEEYSFDAWGQRRDPANWHSPAAAPTPSILIRGYTFHEQLDEVNIINMNGRIYDPKAAQFLQPDPIVQDPGNLQNFNRFSYVLNNPLRYTDPSGYDYREKRPYYHGEGGTCGATSYFTGNMLMFDTPDGASFLMAEKETYDRAFYGFGGGGGGSGGGGGGGGSSAGGLIGGGSRANSSFSGSKLGGGGSLDFAFRGNLGAGGAGGFGVSNFGDPPVTVRQSQNKPLINLGLNRGQEDPWMLGRGGVISYADARATYAEKAAVLGAFTSELVLGVALEPVNLLVKYGFGKFLGKFGTKGASLGKHVVYEGVDAAGKVRYVGITGREPAVRFGEHLSSFGTGKESLFYRIVEGAKGLSRTEARILEQKLINQYGLGRNGGQLLNKVNSIAPKNWPQFGITFNLR